MLAELLRQWDSGSGGGGGTLVLATQDPRAVRFYAAHGFTLVLWHDREGQYTSWVMGLHGPDGGRQGGSAAAAD